MTSRAGATTSTDSLVRAWCRRTSLTPDLAEPGQRAVDVGQQRVRCAVPLETEPELKISERRTVFGNIDGVNYIVPMSDGRFIKLQAKSRGGGDLPDMRLILNWGLPALVAAQR